jgi:hypothetical protein
MRHAYAHEAVLLMPPDSDIRAPGGAITVALCGHVDHQPPCPLAPHHTGADRVGDEVHLRILFATEPDNETLVRERIDRALADEWPVRVSGPSEVTAVEADHAERLSRS